MGCTPRLLPCRPCLLCWVHFGHTHTHTHTHTWHSPHLGLFCCGPAKMFARHRISSHLCPCVFFLRNGCTCCQPLHIMLKSPRPSIQPQAGKSHIKAHLAHLRPALSMYTIHVDLLPTLLSQSSTMSYKVRTPPPKMFGSSSERFSRKFHHPASE